MLDCKKIKRKRSTENLYNDGSKDTQGICSTCTHQGLLILLSPTGTILFQLVFKKIIRDKEMSLISHFEEYSNSRSHTMFIELAFWEEIWCKFSVWNIEMCDISLSVNSLQLSNSSTLTSIKRDVQRHKSISVTLEWSFLIYHSWHNLFFKILNTILKLEIYLRGFVRFYMFCPISNDLQNLLR